jgi:putative membrane protein
MHLNKYTGLQSNLYHATQEVPMSKHRPNLVILAAGAIALGASGISFAAGAPSTPSGDTTLSQQDRAFVATAANAGMEEVAAGKLAEHSVENTTVQQFAHRMVDDHSRANDELKRIAQADNITLPRHMDAKSKHEVDALKRTHDPHFGERYMAHQASDHQEVIDAFQKEADQGRNADLKRFASDTLPTLREHLQLAEQTQREISTRTPTTPAEHRELEASKNGTGGSWGTAEKAEHMPVPKTNN